jgi:hypothetical protein
MTSMSIIKIYFIRQTWHSKVGFIMGMIQIMISHFWFRIVWWNWSVKIQSMKQCYKWWWIVVQHWWHLRDFRVIMILLVMFLYHFSLRNSILTHFSSTQQCGRDRRVKLPQLLHKKLLLLLLLQKHSQHKK